MMCTFLQSALLHLFIYLFVNLIKMYICIHTDGYYEREREREREGGGGGRRQIHYIFLRHDPFKRKHNYVQ